jgi:hypothetical protein
MKGIHGLMVAVALGLAGAAANFWYLNTEAQKKDMVAFIGIKKGAILGRGDHLTDDNLVKVEIPANRVGNLKDYAFLWDEQIGVKGLPVWRTLDSKTDPNTEGTLLLRSDVKTPLKELELGKDEVIRWIPVDSRSFEPALVNPGDLVSFILPKAPPGPTRAPPPKPAAEPGKPADPAGTPAPEPKAEDTDVMKLPASEIEAIGPFTVLSLGNRLGDAKVMQSNKIPQVHENLLGIRVSSKVPQEVEKADLLWARMQAANFRQIGVEKHGK